MTPRRVLILHDYAGARGGAELLANGLRDKLIGRGVEARLFTTTADPVASGPPSDYETYGSSGALRILPETYNPMARQALRRALKDFRPDVVQILMFMTALSPSILPELQRIPTVLCHMTYREVCPTGLRWRPGAGLCDLAVGRACRQDGCLSGPGAIAHMLQRGLLSRWKGAIDRTVAPSRSMADILTSNSWDVTDIVPLGVSSAPHSAAPSDRPLIAYGGRLEPEKGVDLLLRALANAGPALQDTTCEIIGDGRALGELRSLASGLGLADRVRFLGHLPWADAQARLARAWVQVVPSVWPEPFGLVTAEALMRGTPVIASPHGAASEMISHAKTGWITTVEDVDAFSATLIEAMADPGRLAEMGVSGRAYAAEHLTIDRWVDGLTQVFDALVRDRGGESHGSGLPLQTFWSGENKDAAH